jgi:putative DNA methylase
MPKKLIEVALPLEAINAEAAREKSIRHGHPSTLHLWWARRPLAACRAVLFASLVDDPSSNPEQFPTEEAQEEERQRLFRIIERLVNWDNIGDKKLYEEAYNEIVRSTGGNPPPVLDPFAGGGSIPLEAQRLGLEAHASDLNPVAVLINKAMIEIPPRFKDRPPVNPEARSKHGGDTGWEGATGLAEDVRYYGEWMRRKAFEKIGHLYPKITVPATQHTQAYEATVIAWLWTRTVKCPNPACGAEMPLVRSFSLSKKKGHEAWVKPEISADKKSVHFKVQQGKGNVPDGTVNRNGARCICCGEPVGFSHIRSEGKAGRMGKRLMAVVADGNGGRVYLSPNDAHIKAADVPKPQDYPDGVLQGKAAVNVPLYGINKFSDLFTPRQLTSLTMFSDLISEAIAQVEKDAIATGISKNTGGLAAGGVGTKAYAEAVGVYLACALDKLADWGSSFCSWNINREGVRNTFARQAIPMIWDYVETNVFSDSTGCWNNCLEWIYKCIKTFTPNTKGFVIQKDAAQPYLDHSIVISTDPPYYDNIGYADLSDFFYIWLRHSVKNVYPQLFSTMLVPKAEELVATPYRFKDGKTEAKRFFENGMLQAFKGMRKTVSFDYPLTVYYAFKQSESEGSEENEITRTASSGWETMLQAIIRAGFSITGTWPLRTERSGRTISLGSNALASSIAIVCRPRAEDAPSISRRAFEAELREALKAGLHGLQSGSIAPVDLAQASIGPGIAVYSKYKEILGADGKPMTVRQALILINHELDAYLNAQEGNLDPDSRFCISWFEEYGLETADYGRAEVLAKAKLSNLMKLVDDGVLESARGKVRLKTRKEIGESNRTVKKPSVWTLVQRLCYSRSNQDMEKTAELLASCDASELENIKALSYRAYNICERKGWTDEALAYNDLVSIWSTLNKEAADIRKKVPRQGELGL